MTDRKRDFVEQAAPEYWFSYAHELAETADSIFNRSKKQFVAYLYQSADGTQRTEKRPLVSRPVLLLYGIALENMLKAILISEDTSRLEGGKLSKELLGHDLMALSKRCRTVELTESDRDILSLLSNVVPYHGRYPVPRNSEDMKPEEFINEDIFAKCADLFEHLSIELYRLNHMGIEAPEGVHFPRLHLTHLDDKIDFETNW
ncbi:hypothetical protein [uncultured Limimaricola sp.]|uniref:hypothetical protein n=1 Tax=uncultured Limimaricola sp. TaxID=2211667 RepID=UPI0030FBD99D